MIYSLGYIRGIATLFVMLFHFKDFLNEVYAQKNLGSLLFGSGSVGVDLFFVISGFIMVYSTRKNESHAVLKFALRRVFRIYPLLILSVIAFVWVSPDAFSVREIIRSMIPLNKNYYEAAPYFGFNSYPPAWTLTFEVLFYTIFMIAMSVSHKYRALIASVFIICSVFGIQIYFAGKVSLDAHSRVDGVPGFPGAAILQLLASPMLLEFIYGMLLAFLYDQISDGYSTTKNKFSTAYMLIALSLFVTLWFSALWEGAGPVNYGLWALIIIPAALYYEKVNKLKPNKTILFFGDISYSLYMVHIIVPFFLGYKATYDPFYIHLNGVAKLVYVSMLCIVTAYIVHIVIEKPMMNLSRKLIKSIN